MNSTQTIRKTFTKNYIPVYKPAKLKRTDILPDANSTWKGMELIIEDILDGFDLERNSCLDLGVGTGFPTAVFAIYFDRIKGVYTLENNALTAKKSDQFDEVKNLLSDYRTIQLFQSDFRNWIQDDQDQYNLIHVDVSNRYDETYACGLWAAGHSDCTFFHNTESSVEVRQAAIDIALETGQSLYNYPQLNGLGILIDKQGIMKRKSEF